MHLTLIRHVIFFRIFLILQKLIKHSLKQTLLGHIFWSPELKAQMSLSNPMSTVGSPSVHKLFTNFLFFSRTTGPISTKLGTKHSEWRTFNFLQMDSHTFFHGEIIAKITNIHCQYLKIFFSRTTWAISTKLSSKHSWVNGIHVC